MDKIKRFSALLSAIILVCTATGCEKKTSGNNSKIALESSVSATEPTEDSESNNSDSSSDSSTDTENSQAETTTTQAADSTNDNNSETQTTVPADNKTPEATQTTKPQENNSGGTQSGNSQQNNSSSNNSGGNQPATEAPTQAPTEAPAPEEVYTGEIKFGSAISSTGSNITVTGTKALISAGGDYKISGRISDGQLIVNTKEKVKIFLDGVNISNSSGPAIFISDAKKIVIELVDGTTSTITDGGTDKINDGALFSNDTITIKGNGTLNINSNNAHGISSDDDVIIQSGTINITSKKTGIMANDDITINDGTLNIKGGTNGLKSKGTMNINGGKTIVYGGTKEEKSAVFAQSGFTYTGGTLYAAGNAVTQPSSMSAPCFVAAFSAAMPANSTIKIKKNNSDLVTLNPHNSYKCIMIMSSDVPTGSSLSVNIDNKDYGTYTLKSGLNAVNAG